MEEFLTKAGFELLHVFRPCVYNEFVLKLSSSKKPLLLSHNHSLVTEEAQGLLVANNKSLWPTFISFLSKNPSWIDKENPLDDYVEHVINQRFKSSYCSIYYSHKRYLNAETQKQEFLSFQTLAHSAKFAWFHEASHLSLHPICGPWIGLRAVIVQEKPFDVDKPSRFVEEKPYEENPELEEEVKILVNKALSGPYSWKDWYDIRLKVSALKNQWKRYEYSPSQAEYHYTKSKAVFYSSELFRSGSLTEL